MCNIYLFLDAWVPQARRRHPGLPLSITSQFIRPAPFPFSFFLFFFFFQENIYSPIHSIHWMDHKYRRKDTFNICLPFLRPCLILIGGPKRVATFGPKGGIIKTGVYISLHLIFFLKKRGREREKKKRHGVYLVSSFVRKEKSQPASRES